MEDAVDPRVENEANADLEASNTLQRTFSETSLNAKAPEFVPSTPFPHPLETLSSSLDVGIRHQEQQHHHRIPDARALGPIAFLPEPQQGMVYPGFVGGLFPNPPTHMVASSFKGQPMAVLGSESGHMRGGEGQRRGKTETRNSPSQYTGVLQTLTGLEELRTGLVKQIEFYFSDQNLPTDQFLMKHVKKDPEGFVLLSLLASFRKVKLLFPKKFPEAAMPIVIADALKLGSSKLLVSEDGKRVKRLEPLPSVDMREVQTRTVIVENLPSNHSIEAVEALFSKVGKVKMVRVVQAQAANSTKNSKQTYQKKVHALVEFETVEEAEKAAAEVNDESNWRSGLKVRVQAPRTLKPIKAKHAAETSNSRNSKGQGSNSSHREEKGSSGNGNGNGSRNEDSHESEAGILGGEGSSQQIHNGNGEKRVKGARKIPNKSPSKSKGHSQSPEGRSKTPPKFFHGSPLGKGDHFLKQMPKMPDGTRGFAAGRGKRMDSLVQLSAPIGAPSL